MAQLAPPHTIKEYFTQILLGLKQCYYGANTGTYHKIFVALLILPPPPNTIRVKKKSVQNNSVSTMYD